MTNYDYKWKEAKITVNTARNPNKIRLYLYSWDNYKVAVSNILVRLGHIEPIIIPYANDSVEVGYYKRINEIPDDLSWTDAKELAKGGKKLNRGKKPFTGWALAVDKINKIETETFNRNDVSDTYSLDTYVSMLSRLGYLERLDRKGNYKILEKIPENLSSAMANKYLYDKIYKRQRKIEKLREKLTDDNSRNI